MANDHGLRKTFREQLKLRKFDVMAVETRGVSSGAPDSNYCKRGVEVWVEHKRVENNGRVTIRPAQIGWVENRLDHGGRVFCAVRQGDVLMLFHGYSMRQLAEQKVNEVAHIVHMIGGPKRWAWDYIEDILLRWKPLK